MNQLHVDLIRWYKIIFGLVCLNVNDFFLYSTLTPTLEAHPFKLSKAHSTGVHTTFFSASV